MSSNRYAVFTKGGHFKGICADMVNAQLQGPVLINIDESSANYFDAMYRLQLCLQTRLGQLDFKDDKGQTHYVMDQTLYAEAEMHEFLRELKYFKSWKNYDEWDEDIRRQLALEEYVDVLHFIINMAIGMHFTPEEIFNTFVNKNITNHKRQDEGY